MKTVADYIRTIPDFPEPGIMFRDITTVIQDADGLKLAVDEMAKALEGLDFDVIAGAESRGFIFGVPLAFLGVKLGFPLWAVFLCVASEDIVKLIVAIPRLLSNKWIKNVTSQLRLYDNLVDYGTIHLSLTQVEEFTVVEEEEPTLWQRIGDGFVSSVQTVGKILENLLVFFVAALPFLVIPAIIVVVVLVLVRRADKKRKNTPPPANA